MGLLDSGYGGGLLPFTARWSPVDEALRNGTFDPQGMNAAGLFPASATAYASPAPPPGVVAPLPLPMNIPERPVAALPQQQPPLPTQQMPPPLAPAFSDRLNAGLMGFANAGAPIPALANLISGLATGQRSDPVGVQQQTQLETYKALRASGIPKAQARAASLNPEVLKNIVPQYFGAWKIVKTGDNPTTGKRFMMQGPGGELHELETFVRGGGDAQRNR